MRRSSRFVARSVVAALLVLGPGVAVSASPAAAERQTTAGGGSARGGCTVGGVEVDLTGSGDTAAVSGHAVARCTAVAGSRPAPPSPRPYRTYELACSPDRVGAAAGLCSATFCKAGRFFAFRTLHRLDGQAEAAGYSCVSPERALAGPTLTAADVFAVVRRVELPPGAIRIVPSGRGLANLPARLWLVDDALAPVDLPLAGSTVHAEFQPVQYRWTIQASPARGRSPGHAGVNGSGGGALTVTAPADSSVRDGEAGMLFPGGGDFVVSVVTTWTAVAFLDGRYVGQVDGLASTARIGYRVAEIHTALTG